MANPYECLREGAFLASVSCSWHGNYRAGINWRAKFFHFASTIDAPQEASNRLIELKSSPRARDPAQGSSNKLSPRFRAHSSPLSSALPVSALPRVLLLLYNNESPPPS